MMFYTPIESGQSKMASPGDMMKKVNLAGIIFKKEFVLCTF